MRRINPWKLFNGAFLPNWLLVRQELTHGAKVAYARLTEYAGNKGYAFPAEKTLAVSIGVSHRQCQRYVAELISHKLVETEDQGMGRAQRYFFLEHPWMSLRDDIYVVPETTDMSHLLRDSIKETQNSMQPPRQKRRANVPFVKFSEQEWDESSIWLKRFLEEKQTTFVSPESKRLLCNLGWWLAVDEATGDIINPQVLEREFARMKVWLLENPKKAPKEDGVLRFVHNWLQNVRRMKDGSQVFSNR